MRAQLDVDVVPALKHRGEQVERVEAALRKVEMGPMRGLDDAVADSLAHLKGVVESLSSQYLDRSKFGPSQDDRYLLQELQSLSSLSKSSLDELSSLFPTSLDAADAVRRGVEPPSPGCTVVRVLGSAAAVLADFLERCPPPSAALLAKFPDRRSPDGKSGRFSLEGLRLALASLERFLGATASPGKQSLLLLVSSLRLAGKLDAGAAAGTYTTVEYTNALHDALVREVSGNEASSKAFEEGVRKMLAEVEAGASAREAVAALAVSMDEVRSRFVKMQSEIGGKAGTEETFELMKKMSDTLRATLSKTPQLDRLHTLLKRKADREQIEMIDSEIKGLAVDNLPPSQDDW